MWLRADEDGPFPERCGAETQMMRLNGAGAVNSNRSAL